MEEARPPLDPHLSRVPLLPLPFILLCQCVCLWMNPAEFATHSEGKLTHIYFWTLSSMLIILLDSLVRAS